MPESNVKYQPAAQQEPEDYTHAPPTYAEGSSARDDDALFGAPRSSDDNVPDDFKVRACHAHRYAAFRADPMGDEPVCRSQGADADVGTHSSEALSLRPPLISGISSSERCTPYSPCSSSRQRA